MKRQDLMLAFMMMAMVVCWGVQSGAQDSQGKSAADVAATLKSMSKLAGKRENSREMYQAYSRLSGLIDTAEGEKAASEILAATEVLLPEGEMRTEVAATKDKKMASRKLLEFVRNNHSVKAMGKGRVVFGRVKIADGKMEPEMVLAQMVIQPDGWFCTEIGDAAKPLSFRAVGYRMMDVQIPPDANKMNLGDVVMTPITNEETAELKGKVEFQGADGSDQLKATMNYSVPMPNSTTGGYSPRKRWPEPVPIGVKKDGLFEVKGLTPGEYTVTLESPRHERFYQKYEIKSGSKKEIGPIVLRTTDLGFYVGKPTPKAGKFPWEKDIASARKRALAEGKPMMIMMTATWCGPCKMLEENTLSDGWVQQFMKDFVVVKAYEDKSVEEMYNCTAYPTLVFTDKTGKELHRTLGYQPVVNFSGQILKARNVLKLPVDMDLKVLEDKQVVKAPVAMQRIGGASK